MSDYTNLFKARGEVAAARNRILLNSLADLGTTLVPFDCDRAWHWMNRQPETIAGHWGVDRLYIPLPGAQDAPHPVVSQSAGKYTHPRCNTTTGRLNEISVLTATWDLYRQFALTLGNDVIAAHRDYARDKRGWRLEVTTATVADSGKQKFILYFGPGDTKPPAEITLAPPVAGYLNMADVIRPLGSGAVCDVGIENLSRMIQHHSHGQGFAMDYTVAKGKRVHHHIDTRPKHYHQDVTPPERPLDPNATEFSAKPTPRVRSHVPGGTAA